MLSNIFLFFMGYLVAISILSIVVTIHDKHAAIKKRSRVSEKTLFALAILGGSAAMYLTMQTIRHKTKHLRFLLGLPLIFIGQVALVLFVLRYL